MITLVAWLSLCVGFSWLLRRRQDVTMLVIVAGYVLIPPQVEGRLLQMSHPATILLMAHVGVLLTRGDAHLLVALRRSTWIAAWLGALTAYALLDVLNPTGGGTTYAILLTLLKIIWAPFGVFVVIRSACLAQPGAGRRLVFTLLGLGLFEAALGYWQLRSGGTSGMIWERYWKTSWFWTENYSSAIGTTGHPLQLGVFLAMCTALLLCLTNPVIRVVLAAVFVYGISIATARTAFAAALGAATIVVLTSRRRLITLASVAVLAVPAYRLFTHSLGYRHLSDKFVYDGGSTQVRSQALSWAAAHWREFAFFGYPGARDTRAEGLLPSSLENGYLMAGLNFGLVFALGLIALHLALILVPLRRAPGRAWVLVPAALVCIIGFNGSSSFMGGALEGTTLWVALGLLHAHSLDGAPLDRTTKDGDGTGRAPTGTAPSSPAAVGATGAP